MMSGWLTTFGMVSTFMKMPMMGGIKINAKNMIMADKYRVYFKGFFEDQEFSRFESLLGTLMLLFSGVFCSKGTLSRIFSYISCVIALSFFLRYFNSRFKINRNTARSLWII